MTQYLPIKPLMLYSQKGFSLIELMVALTVSMILMAGLTTMVVNTNKSYAELSKASAQLENGRYAMQLLKEEIQHAGYYGLYTELNEVPAAGAQPDPCQTGDSDLVDGLPLPVQGYDAPAGTTLTCLADANHLDGTDILVLRRVATTTTDFTALAAGQVYLQSNWVEMILKAATGASDADFNTSNLRLIDGSDSVIREYQVAIYFISPCSVMGGATCTAASDNGNPVPTLKRLILSVAGGNPTMNNIEPLVEGIENLQIDFGIDGVDPATGLPTPPDGTPDEYRTVPTLARNDVDDVDDDEKMAALRVHILARNTRTTENYSDQKTYSMGLAADIVQPGDAYKRHVFSSLVRVTNVGIRGEV